MNTALLLWHDYRYLPYERDLARREVRALLEAEPEETERGLIVRLKVGAIPDLRKLTYFKGAVIGLDTLVPDQAQFEAAALTNGQTWLPFADATPSMRRQCTRYSAHGLHEYRGKFNPQVVRAIGNLTGMKAGDWVLDPFCGSGTTLLEAAHIGWNAIGFDINPLGVMIANAKVAAFKVSPEVLNTETANLLERITKKEHTQGRDWRTYLPNSDYLFQWFTSSVLDEFTTILLAIEQCPIQELRDVFKIVLSDICREVSLQDPGDLRIRRRKEPYPLFDATADFAVALRSKVDMIRRTTAQIVPKNTRQIAIYGDSRLPSQQSAHYLRSGNRSFLDGAITSPPYATALPYVDTQRLSLCLLGLLQSQEIRAAERALIGNREISDVERIGLEADLLRNAACLPTNVARFCETLLKAADHADHGFRRRNLPALVYKYFAEMAETFSAVNILVRHRGYYALVVGGNKTTLRGEEIMIDTPALLQAVAVSRGWRIADTISLDTYQRYAVHQKNSIRTETLVVLQNNEGS